VSTMSFFGAAVSTEANINMEDTITIVFFILIKLGV